MEKLTMNVFEMYVRNASQAGFWIQRDSWSNTIAQVVEVQFKTSGELEGPPPYYRNPFVFGNVYNLKGQLLESEAKIRSPGTGGYKLIDKPHWFTADTRPT